MLKFRKAAAAVLSAVLVLTTLLMAGCSTPKVAMTVDGKDYTTGEYLAYLYNSFYQVYYGQYLSYYAQSYDVWEQTYPYGEGDDAEELKLSDYISRLAQDTIKRQVAIINRLKEYDLDLTEEQRKELDEALSSLKNDQFIQLGFSNDSYKKMYQEYNYNEKALFYGLYDVGGKSKDAMTDEEIRTYFDENFLSYKIIEKSLVDSSSKKEMSEEEQKAIKDQLNKYLELYKENGDFDKVIEQQKADDEAASTTTTTGTGTTTTTASGVNTTTTTAAGGTTSTSTTAVDSTTSTSGTTTGTTTTTTAASGDGSSTTTTEGTEGTTTTTADANRKDIDANTYDDEDFTDAIKSLEFNEAKVVTYKKGGETLTAALILRLDPEADRGEGVDYFADSHEQVVYGAKFEEYDKELKDYIKTLKVEINDRAVKACDPKKFLES